MIDAQAYVLYENGDMAWRRQTTSSVMTAMKGGQQNSEFRCLWKIRNKMRYRFPDEKKQTPIEASVRNSILLNVAKVIRHGIRVCGWLGASVHDVR